MYYSKCFYRSSAYIYLVLFFNVTNLKIEERRYTFSPTTTHNYFKVLHIGKMTTIGDDVQPVILSNVQHSSESAYNIINDEAVRPLAKYVIRAKLQKMRHLVIQRAIHPEYLESIFPDVIRLFKPQHVQYNQGVDWKISCYLEVMPGGVPCTNPSEKMLLLCKPLLENCNHLFRQWYLQQHANVECIEVRRLMTFITRYTATPGEQALLKHVDGAGKVDGSVVGKRDRLFL